MARDLNQRSGSTNSTLQKFLRTTQLSPPYPIKNCSQPVSKTTEAPIQWFLLAYHHFAFDSKTLSHTRKETSYARQRGQNFNYISTNQRPSRHRPCRPLHVHLVPCTLYPVRILSESIDGSQRQAGVGESKATHVASHYTTIVD